MHAFATLLAVLAVALPTAKPALELTPAAVAPGGAIAVTGSGFRPGPVVLAAGPPRSEADPFATVRADARGRFVARMPIHAGAEPGPYVLLACQDSCRVRASVRFTIVGRPTRARALALVRASLLAHAKACGFSILGLAATSYEVPAPGWRIAARLTFAHDGHVATAIYLVVSVRAVPADPLAGEIEAGCP